MVRKVWFQIMDAATRSAYADIMADSLRAPEDAEDIGEFRKAVWDQTKVILPSYVITANLRIYANRAAYDEENAQHLDLRSSLNSLVTHDTLIVEVLTRREVRGLVGSSIADGINPTSIHFSRDHILMKMVKPLQLLARHHC
ncbi:hypothetical protein GN244_ATG15747 [Phytophthora infestans]|uniref:Uncharacterized protein n=1 Tax=Phytophthora infestans TaxID=4787 RepID=A0A833W758_PHYIN|nr:hypothetical protein GN244_ATG15747 [Phytophthora infestans]